MATKKMKTDKMLDKVENKGNAIKSNSVKAIVNVISFSVIFMFDAIVGIMLTFFCAMEVLPYMSIAIANTSGFSEETSIISWISYMVGPSIFCGMVMCCFVCVCVYLTHKRISKWVNSGKDYIINKFS